MPTLHIHHCLPDSYGTASHWVGTEVLQHLGRYMLFESLKTPYILVQIEDFFQLCGWGYCGMRAYLEALRVYSRNDFNIWMRNVHCFCQLCYL